MRWVIDFIMHVVANLLERAHEVPVLVLFRSSIGAITEESHLQLRVLRFTEVVLAEAAAHPLIW